MATKKVKNRTSEIIQIEQKNRIKEPKHRSFSSFSTEKIHTISVYTNFASCFELVYLLYMCFLSRYQKIKVRESRFRKHGVYDLRNAVSNFPIFNHFKKIYRQ